MSMNMPPAKTFTPMSDVIAFYGLETAPMPTTPTTPTTLTTLTTPTTPPMPAQGEIGSTGSMDGMGRTGGMGGDNTVDNTIEVIKQLYAKKDTIETLFDAMPYWFYAGTDDPAAFAYDPDLDAATAAAIIPVGAINGQGEAASYSNYPGPDGIAAYGGEIPTPYPATADAAVITQIDPTAPLDMVRGVYCSPMYPALSMDDHYPPPSPQPPAYPEYPAPNASAWACWSGTSFATPVISALAACLLEGQQVPYTVNVRQTLKDSAATQQISWTELPTGAPIAGPAIMVMQEFQLSQGNMPVY